MSIHPLRSSYLAPVPVVPLAPIAGPNGANDTIGTRAEQADRPVLAIDPGLSGAVATYDPADPATVLVVDMPTVNGEVDPATLVRHLRETRPAFAVVELVGPMPRDGVRQAFGFGGAYAVAKAAADYARIAAVTIEIRTDADELRQRSAAAALHGIAEGIKEILMPSAAEVGFLKSEETPSPVRVALRRIADIPGPSGEIECPRCAGRLRWTRAETNGHVWERCETDGCLAWMQ